MFILSHLLNVFLSKMAQADEGVDYQRVHRSRNKYSSDSSDQYESERQRVRAMRKKDLFRRKSKESSDSDTPKSSFMLRQYRPMNMDRASKVLHDKNSSNRLISKSTLGPKNKKRDQPNDYRPAISVISEKFSE